MTNYQDTWAAGAVKAIGERDCTNRYEAIRMALSSLQQPFTAMDLGANGGYFSIRLAEDFDCHVTAIDDHLGLHQIASDRITVINRRVNAGGLRGLERHDVTIALSVLHHLPDWRDILEDLITCRFGSIIEVPHPDETWFRMAKARHEVPVIHETVENLTATHLGSFERVGRDKKSYLRPMFFLPGRIRRLTGVVFPGSGANSRWMRQFGNGLASQLGYEPFWGSLNVRFPDPVSIGSPRLDYLGHHRNKTRDYQFWRAWIGNIACHVMVPGTRGHGPNCLEIVAPIRLRDCLNLTNGDTVTIDIETGSS